MTDLTELVDRQEARTERADERKERKEERAERSLERVERSGERVERSGERDERKDERVVRSAMDKSLKERFDMHEAICAERYGSMQKQLARIEWIIYGLAAAILAAAGKVVTGL